ncbi:hypothetical protein V500_03044 [Pseudogymnoascus sp. VKM F-4518 (FW-2643)]|nr:hypothetical protein V500_03044 [Pseudogymnoascus sp. VKM F-4518 (FW-2643)]
MSSATKWDIAATFRAEGLTLPGQRGNVNAPISLGNEADHIIGLVHKALKGTSFAIDLDVEDADAVMVPAGDYGTYRAARCNLERGSGAARRIPRGEDFLVCCSEGDLASDLDKGTRTELDDGVRSSSSQGVVDRVLITRANTSS